MFIDVSLLSVTTGSIRDSEFSHQPITDTDSRVEALLLYVGIAILLIFLTASVVVVIVSYYRRLGRPVVFVAPCIYILSMQGVQKTGWELAGEGGGFQSHASLTLCSHLISSPYGLA